MITPIQDQHCAQIHKFTEKTERRRGSQIEQAPERDLYRLSTALTDRILAGRCAPLFLVFSQTLQSTRSHESEYNAFWDSQHGEQRPGDHLSHLATHSMSTHMTDAHLPQRSTFTVARETDRETERETDRRYKDRMRDRERNRDNGTEKHTATKAENHPADTNTCACIHRPLCSHQTSDHGPD